MSKAIKTTETMEQLFENYATFLKKIPNDDIPVILAIVGFIMNLFVSGFSLEAGVWGSLMGLASTGMHQAISRFIDSYWQNKTE